MMARSEIHHIRRRALMEDEGQAAILALTVAAALASLAAIFAHLGPGAGGGGGPHVGTPRVRGPDHRGVLDVHSHDVRAALRARVLYRSTGAGWRFPGGEQEPDYGDFVYFSFVIGMTSQVSDVG